MVLAAHESFLWVHDLSQPDLWLFPILAGVATFISMKLTQSSSGNAAANGSMKVMQYFMPIMIVWMGADASGRSLPVLADQLRFPDRADKDNADCPRQKIISRRKKKAEKRRRNKQRAFVDPGVLFYGKKEKAAGRRPAVLSMESDAAQKQPFRSDNGGFL